MQNKQHNSLIGMLLTMIIVVGWNLSNAPTSMAMNAQQDAAMQRVTESLQRQELTLQSQASTWRNLIRNAIVNNSELQEALDEYNTMVDQLSESALRLLIVQFNFIQKASCASLKTTKDFKTARNQLKTVLVYTDIGDVKAFTDWLYKVRQKMRTLATQLNMQNFLDNIDQGINKNRKQGLNQYLDKRLERIDKNTILDSSAKQAQQKMFSKVVEEFTNTSKVNSTPSQEAIDHQISQWFITASAVLELYAPIMIEHMPQGQYRDIIRYLIGLRPDLESFLEERKLIL